MQSSKTAFTYIDTRADFNGSHEPQTSSSLPVCRGPARVAIKMHDELEGQDAVLREAINSQLPSETFLI
jgi:hypothetical protein